MFFLGSSPSCKDPGLLETQGQGRSKPLSSCSSSQEPRECVFEWKISEGLANSQTSLHGGTKLSQEGDWGGQEESTPIQRSTMCQVFLMYYLI